MFFPQANETQDPSDMSDPSEVNQPQPVLFVQGPGRYIQVPYYVPVPTSHVYSNYAVDPSQTHWYPVPPYGNTPILNGRQSESDGTESEANVEDERSGTTSFPPPGVGLPAATTMQPHHLYQMMSPLSNHLYVGSIPSGVSVQGYVNSPIPYPTSYATSMPTGGDPNTPQPQPNANRGGGGGSGGGGGGGGGGSGSGSSGGAAGRNNGKNSGGGGTSGAKISSDKQGGANDCSVSYGASATSATVPQPPPSALTIGQDASGSGGGGNDPSTPTLPATSMPMTAPPPPHHQPNFMPLGPMQYSYPYFSPTGPPHPPPHMTSAQHATGSPIYIPHPPAVPMYHHAPIYNSGPTAVFSTENGISPHSTVTVPVSVSMAHPPSDLPPPQQHQQHHHHHQHHHQQQQQQQHQQPPPPHASPSSSVNHENDSGSVSFNIKENAVTSPNETTFKNSNLMADSAPFEPENQKNAASANYAQTDASSVCKDVTGDSCTLPQTAAINESVTVTSSIVYVSASRTAAGDSEKYESSDDRTKSKVDNVCSLTNDLRITDSKETGAASLNDATDDSIVAEKMDYNDANNVSSISSACEMDARTNDASASGGSIAATASFTSSCSSSSSSSCSSGAAPVSWNATNNTAVVTSSEHLNGKTNSSPDTASSSAFDLSAARSTSSSDAKSNEVIEDQAAAAPPAVQSSCKKSWASLFKETPSTKCKISSLSQPLAASSSSSTVSAGGAAVRSSAGEHLTGAVSSAAFKSTAAHHHHAVENTSSKSSSSGNSSLNGMPSSVSSSSHRGKPSAYKLSSPSLADDTVLPKIGELLKNYKLDHRAVNIEPRGLENKSNYCYINAILQALLACPPFYNLMKFISHNLHHHKTKVATKQHLPIIDSMVQFVEEFKLVPQKARRDKTRKLDSAPQEIVPGKPFEPSYMYNMLSVIQNNSSFVMGQQEDAQEFLTCLLNGLNDEMVELIQLADGATSGTNHARKSQLAAKTLPVSKNNKKISNGDIASDIGAPDDSDSEWKQVHPKMKPHRPNLALTRTPLSDIFRGQMRSVLAKIGDQCTSSIEPFFTLHLNIEKVNSVKQALELLPGRDNLEGVTSSRTNQEVDAYQQQYLEELPYVLLLHLKYFDYKHHTCRKIKKSIEFPIDLKLDMKLISTQSPSHPKTAPSKSRQYKLFAVVYHDGNEATKGHYITDVFHIGYGGWVRYDDARVWTVSENDVLRPDLPRVPYLLYYRRCDTIAALMQPPFEKRM